MGLGFRVADTHPYFFGRRKEHQSVKHRVSERCPFCAGPQDRKAGAAASQKTGLPRSSPDRSGRVVFSDVRQLMHQRYCMQTLNALRPMHNTYTHQDPQGTLSTPPKTRNTRSG